MSRSRILRGGLLATLLMIAASCTDGDEGGTAGGEGRADVDEVKIVWAGEVDASVPQAGAWRFASEFGLNEQDEGDIQIVPSHATASQILLAGRADVLVTTFTTTAQLVAEGQDIKAFCPEQGDTTEHLVGVGISNIEDITNPEIRVGVDSPGGLVNYVMNHVFRARGLTNDEGEPLTVNDLENITILEDGGLRLAALANDEIDVGSVDLFELPLLAEELGEDAINILSVTAADVDDAVGNVFMARGEWLEENPDAAAALCATVLKANRELAADFDLFQEWAIEIIEPDPDEETLRTNWEFVRENGVWPFNPDILLNEEAVSVDLEVLVATGLLDESASTLSFDQLVDLGPSEQALEMVGGPIDDVSELEG